MNRIPAGVKSFVFLRESIARCHGDEQTKLSMNNDRM